MESTKEQEFGLLHQILPPRLEDAGLEDCALPPESIKEAFLKAASSVKSRAGSIFSADDEEDAGCVGDPWPTAKDASDAVIGIEPENEPPQGPCSVEKGGGMGEIGADEVKVGGGSGDGVAEVGDKLVVGEEGVKLGEGGKGCVDDLKELGVEDNVKNGDGGEDEGGKEKKGKRPTLVEGYV